ncbi:hypothetical protein IT774_16180 [Salinimonas marina]|uniref:HPt domain-containing protein n=1 Tax=Salinimonas marina TaxID=2785918 RepID=A0A7S9DXR1_9ALTE|nr:hypothetical protein [Salinimonas marina]QPG05598.1 hypothetical protein IT774_16180 [Salinimonas marina]
MNMQDLELYQRLDGNKELAEKLIARFATSLPILIVRLTLALKNQDSLRAGSQLTMLKEVASALSAPHILRALTELETQLQGTSCVPSQDCISRVEHIAADFSRHLHACSLGK